MKSYFQSLDQTCAKIMAIAFVGIHIPMVAMVLYGIMNGFSGLGALIGTILVATLVSTAGSLAFIQSLYSKTGVSDLHNLSHG